MAGPLAALSVVLGLDSRPIQAGLSSAEKSLGSFSQLAPEVTLGVDQSAVQGDLANAQRLLGQFDSMTASAALSVDEAGVTADIGTASRALDMFDQESASAALTLDDAELRSGLKQADAELRRITGQKKQLIRLGVDSGPLIEELDRAEAEVRESARKMGGALDGIEAHTTKAGGFFTRFGTVGQGAIMGVGLAIGNFATNVLGGAVIKIKDFFGDSIEAASDLNETISKGKVIFGDSAAEIEAWGLTAAETFGQSQRQAIDTATGFAGLFKTVGVELKTATGYSKALTELGSDLASFFNTDVQSALDAVRSGLSGEAEPLKRFNVFLSETAVQAEAVRLGFKKVDGQFTESAKVQARYSLIMQQTADAQGDFVRTADGLANSQRSVAAATEDVQAKLGQKLLPVQLKVNQAMLEGTAIAADFFDILDRGFGADLTPQIEQNRQNFLGSFPSRAEVQAVLDSLSRENLHFDSPFQETLFNFDVGGVQTTWKGQIDALNAYLQNTAFDETGNAVQRGLSDSEAQLRQNWAALAPAAGESGTRIGHAFGLAVTNASADPEAINAMVAGFERIWAAEKQRFSVLGSDASAVIARGMTSAEASSVMEQHVNSLKQIVETEWSAGEKAKFALGAAYIKTVRQGMESESADTVNAARAVAIEGINAIEDAGRNDKKGTKRLGELYMELMQSGMTAEQAATALKAGNVAESTIDALEAKYLTTGAYNAGEDIGTNFKQGLLATIQEIQRAADKMARVAEDHLTYHSPAKAGPWSRNGGPGKWLRDAGRGMGTSLASGLLGSLPMVSLAADRLALASSPLIGASRFGVRLNAPRASNVATVPTVVAGVPSYGPPLTVIFNGPIYGHRAGLRQLVKDIAEEVRFSTRRSNVFGPG